MIQTIAIIFVIVLILVGILMVPLSLPGTWVIAFTGVMYSLIYPFDGGATSVYWVNGWLIGLAIFGELMEFGVGTLGGKAVKVSTGAILSAFIGGLIGLFVGVPVFLVGSLIGLFLGAFLGAFFYELVVIRQVGRAFATACTVLATRIVASMLKLILGIGMAVFLLINIF